jgi:hypothetical protein
VGAAVFEAGFTRFAAGAAFFTLARRVLGARVIEGPCTRKAPPRVVLFDGASASLPVA